MSIVGEYTITKAMVEENEVFFYQGKSIIISAPKFSPWARLTNVVPFKIQYIQTEKDFKILGILPI